MDTSEAKAILSAYRADLPEEDGPAMHEALDLLENDPELAQWFADEMHFDEHFSAALNDIVPPADLKDKLLALDPEKTIPFPQTEAAPKAPADPGHIPGQRPWWRRSSILSAAATLVVFLGFALVLFDPVKVDAEPDLEQFYSQIIDNYESNPRLTQQSTDMKELRQWLNTSGLPSPRKLPPKVDALAEVGAGSLTYHGKQVSYIKMEANGKPYCLYLIDRSMGEGLLPMDGTPVVIQQKDASLMAWVGSDYLYVLIVRGSVEEMKELL